MSTYPESAEPVESEQAEDPVLDTTLRMLHSYGRVYARELAAFVADREGVSLPEVSRRIDGLVDQGILERNPDYSLSVPAEENS